MPVDFKRLAQQIKTWGLDLGFQQIGISDIDLKQAEQRLKIWLAKQYHGEMHYMHQHGEKRTDPQALVPGTIRIISVRMNYMPPDLKLAKRLTQAEQAYVSCYAMGRDYHKLIRKRLQKLANQINTAAGPFRYRAFADSAPVMEKPIAEKAGLGWIGKNTLLLNPKAGSWFFLGTLYTDLPLPIDEPIRDHCGRCQACIDICPTQAIVAPYQLDARKCISYLTIEYKGIIPTELRRAIGNRIYGCDDCQLVCPWNRFARITGEPDFHARHGLDNSSLLQLFNWSEQDFLRFTEGSAIRRIGYDRWQRNIAIALGNAPTDPAIITSLQQRLTQTNDFVAEHVRWALDQQQAT